MMQATETIGSESITFGITTHSMLAEASNSVYLTNIVCGWVRSLLDPTSRTDVKAEKTSADHLAPSQQD